MRLRRALLGHGRPDGVLAMNAFAALRRKPAKQKIPCSADRLHHANPRLSVGRQCRLPLRTLKDRFHEISNRSRACRGRYILDWQHGQPARSGCYLLACLSHPVQAVHEKHPARRAQLPGIPPGMSPPV